MARARQEANIPERTKLVTSHADALERVERQLERGRSVPDRSINEDEEARRWYDFTLELLRQICNTDELRNDFAGVGSYDDDITTGKYLRRLHSIRDRLELLPVSSEVVEMSLQRNARHGADPSSRSVFIVHGHDDGVKETVARYLSKLGLDPVILHEQPNKGRTIIEKFEELADVAFAVVLFTGDDMGYPKGKADSANPRARQNVVLELGFFLGALGRKHVCVLYRDGVEVPSDYSGVLYEQFDDKGAWRMKLALELKAAGLDVDLNKAI
ncbi:MAG: DNA-binding protein [Candidimonas sp.]|nr:MAG: DNA-binding protein [Candidimonas sp.]TAM23182.1 MAG: DNA-binding protein [Candidimonas sp.]